MKSRSAAQRRRRLDKAEADAEEEEREEENKNKRSRNPIHLANLLSLLCCLASSTRLSRDSGRRREAACSLRVGCAPGERPPALRRSRCIVCAPCAREPKHARTPAAGGGRQARGPAKPRVEPGRAESDRESPVGGHRLIPAKRRPLRSRRATATPEQTRQAQR